MRVRKRGVKTERRIEKIKIQGNGERREEGREGKEGEERVYVLCGVNHGRWLMDGSRF